MSITCNKLKGGINKIIAMGYLEKVKESMFISSFFHSLLCLSLTIVTFFLFLPILVFLYFCEFEKSLFFMYNVIPNYTFCFFISKTYVSNFFLFHFNFCKFDDCIFQPMYQMYTYLRINSIFLQSIYFVKCMFANATNVNI